MRHRAQVGGKAARAGRRRRRACTPGRFGFRPGSPFENGAAWRDAARGAGAPLTCRAVCYDRAAVLVPYTVRGEEARLPPALRRA